jgi:hypothetical protein
MFNRVFNLHVLKLQFFYFLIFKIASFETVNPNGLTSTTLLVTSHKSRIELTRRNWAKYGFDKLTHEDRSSEDEVRVFDSKIA